MLKPETARTILNVIVNLVVFIAGITGILMLWSLLTRGMKLGTLSTGIPVSMGLMIGDQSYQISRVNVLFSQPGAWMWTLWLLFIALLLTMVVLGYSRIKRFINRLLDDPFAPENAADLRLASRVALFWQGLTLVMAAVYWWAVIQIRPVDAMKTAVASSPGVKIVDGSYNFTLGSLNVLGIDLTPLLIAALLAILATVFQRGHDLREAERSLRAEQELTV